MAVAKPKRRSVNYDIINIIKNYFKLSSKEEIRFDIVIPFIISCLTVLLLFLRKSDMLEILQEINNVIISVMSILAGFNTASVAIIASSNPLGFVEELSDNSNEQEGRDLLNSLTSYFSYAIVLQLFILIISIIASVALKFFDIETFKENTYLFISLSMVFIVWFTLVLNSLFITMRNASILHNFILYLAKRK
jgi:phosphoglycerol transferase MdoB-like AlkP superfamily enzyme